MTERIPSTTDRSPSEDVPDGDARRQERPTVRAPRHPPDGDETVEHPTMARLQRADWPDRRTARILVVINVLFASGYVGWWLAGDHTGDPILFYALAAAEAFSITHLIAFWQAVWNAGLDLPPPGRTRFTVDVYIPTLGEPLDLLRRTIAGAVGMEGEHQTWVLDDGCRDEVRALAEELGAHYLCRESSAGAKAGNLNHALARTDGDLVVVFDADHVPRRDFLTHLLGYFEDPEVAIVQTPQLYGNAPYNAVARGAWYAQIPFYGPIMRGKHDLGTALLCGSNGVIRREALERIGGFREDSIVEDFVTTMTLHDAGWKAIYFPYVLAEGEGPTTVRAYMSQQLRWARGGMGALRNGEPFRRGLTFLQRLHHLLVTTAYLYGFAVLVYLSLPVVWAFTGRAPFGMEAGTFVLFYVPYMVTTLGLMRRELGGNFGLRHLQFFFGTFPVYILAAFLTLIGRDVSFSATGSERGGRPPLVAWVTVVAWLALAASVVVAPLRHGFDGFTALNVTWALIDLAFLTGIVKVTVLDALGRLGEREPRIGAETGHSQSAPTYLLGNFAQPPLPEQVPVEPDRVERAVFRQLDAG